MAEFQSAGTDRQLAEFSPGTLIGGYRLEEPIGAGGMARVFRARDEALDRTVALKVLAPVLTTDVGFRERFIRESRAASVVDHPNIIPIYGAGEDAGVLYLAMRYVSGGDLHSVVDREGPLPPERVVALAAPVASALDAAHRAGIVHRDVKPANVLVDVSPGRPDHPYLSDFGLAKREAAAALTNAGEFIGTAGFAAPEQIDGRPARFESDQYALACVVFTLLTRRLPFRSQFPEAVLWAQMSQPPPRVTPMRPDFPAGVDDVIARAMAKDPRDRFADCTDFITTLGRVLAGAPLPWNGAPAYSPPRTRDAGPVQNALPVRDVQPVPGAPPAQGALPVRGASPAGKLRGGESPVHEPSVRVERPDPRLPNRDVVSGPGMHRARVPRIAVVAAVVAVAAAAVGGTVLLRPTGSSPANSGGAIPGSDIRVSAKLAATLRDPDGQMIVSAAFGPAGTVRVVDSSTTSYTFGVASQRVQGQAQLGVLGANGGALTLNGQWIAAPGAGCLPGGVGACSYGLFQYSDNSWGSNIQAGPGSPVAVGDSALAITSEFGASNVEVWNLQTIAPVATVTEPDHRAPGSIALSPGGDTVATVSAATGNTRKAYVWSVASASAPATVLPIPGNMGVTRTAQGSQSLKPLAIAGSTLAASDGLTTNVYHLGTRAPVTSVPADLLALSPDGTLVATSDRQDAAGVDLRNAATGQAAATLTAPGEQQPPTSVAFSADGRSVAVGYSDGQTRVWDLTES